MGRHLVYRVEYVKENNIQCEIENCSNAAYATWYDINWNEHDYCESCLEEIQKDVIFLQQLKEAYEEQAKLHDPNDPWFNDYEHENKYLD